MSWLTTLMALAVALPAHPERSDVSRGVEGSPFAHPEHSEATAHPERSEATAHPERSEATAHPERSEAESRGPHSSPSTSRLARYARAERSAATDGGMADGGSRAHRKPIRPMAPDVKALVDRMQAFYERTSDFTAGFRQEYTYQIARRTQSSSGKVLFLKPAMMRWEYEKPSRKVFVLAAEKAYAYDPEALTLTITNVKTNELSASVTFLMGVGRLENEFSIARADCPSCKGVLLELAPLRPDQRFRMVKLEVDPQTAQVLKSTVVDPDGSQNAISFFDLKTNQGISKDQFKLKTTDDTHVIDLTKAAK